MEEMLLMCAAAGVRVREFTFSSAYVCFIYTLHLEGIGAAKHTITKGEKKYHGKVFWLSNIYNGTYGMITIAITYAAWRRSRTMPLVVWSIHHQHPAQQRSSRHFNE